MLRPRPHFDRYERVYCPALGEYGNLIAPGASGGMVTVAFSGSPHCQINRTKLRRLHWWERLLNR